MRVYFFGVMHAGQAGHFLYVGELGRFAGVPWRDTPIVLRPGELDGKFTHATDKTQGAARLVRKDGYTMMAWHDYTGDSRPASNSVLAVEGVFDFIDMMQLYVQHLPDSITRRQRLPYLVDIPA